MPLNDIRCQVCGKIRRDVITPPIATGEQRSLDIECKCGSDLWRKIGVGLPADQSMAWEYACRGTERCPGAPNRAKGAR